MSGRPGRLRRKALPRNLTKLDAIRERLIELVAAVDEPDFDRRPSLTEWSVAEVLQHLSLVERHVITALDLALAGPQQRLPLCRGFVPLSIVGLRLFRVTAPRVVEPLNPPPKQELIENLKATRASLKALGENAGSARLRQTIFKHPFPGPLDGQGALRLLRIMKRGTINRLAGYSGS